MNSTTNTLPKGSLEQMESQNFQVTHNENLKDETTLKTPEKVQPNEDQYQTNPNNKVEKNTQGERSLSMWSKLISCLV
jgi:hypothetical protein